MKTLQNQLIDHISELDIYCKVNLAKSVRQFNSKHKQPNQEDMYYSLEDVHSHLRLEVITSVTNKYNKSGFSSDHNLKKYVKAIAYSGIKRYLMKQGDYIMGKNEYINDKKGRMILESECQNYRLGVHFDEMPYGEFRELLKKNLTLRHNLIIHAILSKYEIEEIATTLKISPDYVRKLFKEAKEILIDVLNLNHTLPQKNKKVEKIDIPKETMAGKATYKEKRRLYQKGYDKKNKEKVA